MMYGQYRLPGGSANKHTVPLHFLSKLSAAKPMQYAAVRGPGQLALALAKRLVAIGQLQVGDGRAHLGQQLLEPLAIALHLRQLPVGTGDAAIQGAEGIAALALMSSELAMTVLQDRKSTRLNYSPVAMSY